MNTKPILFSEAMVKALLAGKKTQTRRVAKLTDAGRVREVGSRRNWHPESEYARLACPYGQPGDQLWVKETWATDWIWDDHAPVKVPASQPILYRADEAATGVVAFEWGRWRPSIFMRQWMSRIRLEIANVRLERLHALTEGDAMAEGCAPVELTTSYHILCRGGSSFMLFEGYVGGIPQPGELWQGRVVEYVQSVPPHKFTTACAVYRALWEKINPDTWDANPWVWVIDFKVV